MDLLRASINDVVTEIKAKKISAKEVAQFFLDRAKAHDSKINTIVSFNEKLINDANRIDDLILRGEDPGPLAGIPFGIKDLFCTRDLRTTAGSKMLEQFVPHYDATAVSRLKQSGGLILAKMNLDEFAMGSSNETSFFGASKNPWNSKYVPGGSSGGSAAAQAAGFSMASLGTDTGGSIRQPASFCGVVGVKPTYGRISRYGIIAYASSLDQAGPITRTVEDAALCLESICGPDEKDQTTSTQPIERWSKNLNKNISGKRVGIIKEYFKSGGLEKSIEESLSRAIEHLKKEGAEITEVSIPLVEFAVPTYYLIASSEASSNLARYDGVKYGHRASFDKLSSISLSEFYEKNRSEGFGEEVKRRIMLGTYCLSSGYYDAYYLKACQVRRLLRDQFVEAFKECDVLMGPVTSSPAFQLGSRISDPLTMYLNDIFTVSTSLAGLPGISVPYGISPEGLPIGIQLIANHFDEQSMLNFASVLEQENPLSGEVLYV